MSAVMLHSYKELKENPHRVSLGQGLQKGIKLEALSKVPEATNYEDICQTNQDSD